MKYIMLTMSSYTMFGSRLCLFFAVFVSFRITSSLTFTYQLMGLAVYNSIALDIHFPLYCYRYVSLCEREKERKALKFLSTQ